MAGGSEPRKRHRGDSSGSSAESPTQLTPPEPPSPPLSAEEVRVLSAAVNQNIAAILSLYPGERTVDRREKVQVAITEISNAFNKISNAYISQLAEDSLARKCINSLESACSKIDKMSESLSRSQPSATSFNAPSYSNVLATRNTNANNRVSQSIPLRPPSTFRFVIGPKNQDDEQYANAASTKEKLTKILDPVELKLNANRISSFINKSVLIEANSVDLAKLKNNAALAEAGLELKPDVKLRPRLIIRNVPVSLSSEELIDRIVKQNCKDSNRDDIKFIFGYPAKGSLTHSVVIEVTPEIRSILYKNGRIYIGLTSCRFDDHLIVKQCYNCLKFGHIASECRGQKVCSTCAGVGHSYSECTSQQLPCCSNCKNIKPAKSTGLCAHSATDRSKCPILRAKLADKANSTDYGK